MTKREIVLDSIAHRQTPVVPYTISVEEEVAQRLDAHYGSRAAWNDRIVPYMNNVYVVATDYKAPLDATHNQDVYGGIWRIDRRPWHLETPPLAEPTFDGYVFPKAERFFRPEEKAAAWKRCESLESFRIGNLGWGLFERCWTLRGFENALMDAVAEPDFFEEMLDKLLDLYLEFVDYTVDLPIDGVLFGDDWGDQNGIILGPERWRKFLKPRWAKIYERVHKAGKIVMSHSCGSVCDIVPDLIEIGLDVLESCQPEARGMAPELLKSRWGDKISFWGCLGSQRIIPFGTPTELRDEIRRLRRVMGAGGGYILAPAKPLMPETPTENAVAPLETFWEARP